MGLLNSPFYIVESPPFRIAELRYFWKTKQKLIKPLKTNYNENKKLLFTAFCNNDRNGFRHKI